MKRLLAVLLILILVVIGIGYYRDWFSVRSGTDDKSVHIEVTVDKEKVREDEERAHQKLKQVEGEMSDKLKKQVGK